MASWPNLKPDLAATLSAHGRDSRWRRRTRRLPCRSLRKALGQADSLEAQRGIMMLELDAGRTAEAWRVAKEVQKQRPKEAVGYVFEGDAHVLKKSGRQPLPPTGRYQTNRRTELAVKLHAALLAGGKWLRGRQVCRQLDQGSRQGHAFPLLPGWSANRRKDYAAASNITARCSRRSRTTPRCSTTWRGSRSDQGSEGHRVCREGIQAGAEQAGGDGYAGR
jgi:hypothetical protein